MSPSVSATRPSCEVLATFLLRRVRLLDLMVLPRLGHFEADLVVRPPLEEDPADLGALLLEEVDLGPGF